MHCVYRFGRAMSNSFEARYLTLRQTGADGWGGSQFNRRQAEWANSLAVWQAHALLPPPPGPVLELGCGNGMVSEMLAAISYEIKGLDISATAVAWAQDRFQALGLRGEFQQGDARGMPDLDDNRFALIVDGNSFHCMIGDDRALYLAEVRRLLKTGGRFILSSMCGEPRSEEARARFNAASHHLFEDGKPARTLAPIEDLMRELRGAGLSVVWKQVAENPWWDHITAVARVA